MKNLDYHAQLCAQEILSGTRGEEAETLSTKALGALEEGGVYACLLFLMSRSSKERPLAQQISGPLRKLASEAAGTNWDGCGVDAVLKTVTTQICSNPETMLLVRDAWRQALIYTRYGARARGKGGAW